MPKVSFIGEHVLPTTLEFKNTKVGGLSSIDFHDGKYFLISDDKKNPRFYNMNIQFEENGIDSIEVVEVTFLKKEGGEDFKKEDRLDPEGLRYNSRTNSFYIVDEGSVKNNVNAKLYKMNDKGFVTRNFNLPKSFFMKKDKDKWGPRNNKSLESISLSYDGKRLFVAMECPLKQDGDKPKLKQGKYPVRVLEIEMNSGVILNQYVYLLDPIAREKKDQEGVQLNGLAEILSFDSNSLLFVERSFSSGYDDGGNDVKVYRAYIDKATDVSKIESLKEADYQPLNKELFFDFETVRDQMTNGVVDNIEGICFGPKLKNGNRTLLFVADDNFGKYGSQLNQFVALELHP